MAKFALLLLGAGLAAARVIYDVPDPYRWDESFTVKMPQFDDEHRGLFNGLYLIQNDNSEKNLKDAIVKFHDHFKLEESHFAQTMSLKYTDDHKAAHNRILAQMNSWEVPVPPSELMSVMNWLVQHIKNIDFQYVGQLPHYVKQTPIGWDDSLEVFYARLDEEHIGLFDAIKEVGMHPDSTKDLADLKGKMRAHFDYERGIFCDSKTYHDCEGHSAKHDRFFKQLFAVTNPVSAETVHWAANWLVQHIRNTDFKYKHKLDKYQHDVPRPYVWNPTFSVYYDRLDDEHVKLFDAIRDSVDHPADAGKLEFLQKIMKEHFDYEQGEFSKVPDFEEYIADHIEKHNTFLAKLNAVSVPLDCDFINYVEDWLAQHIKNTDFAYRHKLVHEVPEPYVWNESFMTFYKRIDDEHKGLFDCIADVADHPDDAAKAKDCQNLLRRHFDYEESEFCAVHNYDCHGHYLKHYNFQMKFQGAPTPVPAEITDFAKNWLAQHIKNTDFAYRGKLHARRHYVVPDPYVWDKSFEVHVKQMDDEHVILFDAVRGVEEARDSQEAWDHMIKVYVDHFRAEEALFTTIKDADFDPADHRNRHLYLMNTIGGAVLPITEEMTEFIKNWLTQHIKNTDFKYVGKMPKQHPIPEPFLWNAFFAVHYKEMDEEHKVLFSCLHDVEQNPDDADILASCIKSYDDHFQHEEKLLKESGQLSEEYVYGHMNKHAAFMATVHGHGTPVDPKWIAFAKNWLSQHIPNTDFIYLNKMPYEVPDPYVWDESFQVNYKRLDDEHVVLFKALQDMKDNPDDVDILNNNRDVFRDHFDYEEKQFMVCGESCGAAAHKKKHDIMFKTLTWVKNPVSTEYVNFVMNWLAQHIKNTDFKYKYKLPTKHAVPEPYVWNTDFEVSYPRLDEEHVVLFKAMLDVERDLNSQEKVDTLMKLLRNHFYYEEGEFCDALNLPWDYCKNHKDKHSQFSNTFSKVHAPVALSDIKWAQNWLAQHIRNTDFGYKGHLKHEVPEPYVWDSTFSVDYHRLDEEHIVLFANILAVSQNPSDDSALQTLKDNMRLHFDYEQQRYCAVPNYNCVDHKMKHYKFWVVLEDQKTPVGCEEINWAKNWLAQHIKNTDHQYKKRLDGPDQGDNFSGALP